ncbi:hypothetical protein ONZ43_g6190 [Nemania bipapillata]|uniref:Uncharacterized protein n=1 Tax=Nemania bipapillata TaxID=110536 RepID=A0ACC2I278_9PEZI|nr:hypothetical protein ONZ43_g6190 [Nemania bipapillata]
MPEIHTKGAAKRARSPEDEDHDAPARKHQRSEDPRIQGEDQTRAIENTSHFSPKPPKTRPPVAEDILELDPIDFWVKQGHWPRQYFEPEMKKRGAIPKRLTRPKPKRTNSVCTSVTPTDQRSREEKSKPYANSRYPAYLSAAGAIMEECDKGITEESAKTYMALLTSEQTHPNESLFGDAFFKKTCRRVADRNEAKILRVITPLLVPSAEDLMIQGDTKLQWLIESINEGWNNSIPLTGTRPQPDYSVGFRRDAFSKEQLQRLAPLLGDYLCSGDLSAFLATYYIYFPFFACEVKSGTAALDLADRQNAHSMSMAARGVFELFRYVGRQKEVDRQILSFSVSHDQNSVRIYGYYPVVEGKEAKYYRHPIHNFSFTEMDGRQKWDTYQFTKNVYDTWMPDHFKRICSAIDQLPLKEVTPSASSVSDSASVSEDFEDPDVLEPDTAGNPATKTGQMAPPDIPSARPRRVK